MSDGGFRVESDLYVIPYTLALSDRSKFSPLIYKKQIYKKQIYKKHTILIR